MIDISEESDQDQYNRPPPEKQIPPDVQLRSTAFPKRQCRFDRYGVDPSSSAKIIFEESHLHPSTLKSEPEINQLDSQPVGSDGPSITCPSIAGPPARRRSRWDLKERPDHQRPLPSSQDDLRESNAGQTSCPPVPPNVVPCGKELLPKCFNGVPVPNLPASSFKTQQASRIPSYCLPNAMPPSQYFHPWTPGSLRYPFRWEGPRFAPLPPSPFTFWPPPTVPVVSTTPGPSMTDSSRFGGKPKWTPPCQLPTWAGQPRGNPKTPSKDVAQPPPIPSGMDKPQRAEEFVLPQQSSGHSEEVSKPPLQSSSLIESAPEETAIGDEEVNQNASDLPIPLETQKKTIASDDVEVAPEATVTSSTSENFTLAISVDEADVTGQESKAVSSNHPQNPVAKKKSGRSLKYELAQLGQDAADFIKGTNLVSRRQSTRPVVASENEKDIQEGRGQKERNKTVEPKLKGLFGSQLYVCGNAGCVETAEIAADFKVSIVLSCWCFTILEANLFSFLFRSIRKYAVETEIFPCPLAAIARKKKQAFAPLSSIYRLTA